MTEYKTPMPEAGEYDIDIATGREKSPEVGRIVCDGLVKIYKVEDLEVVALQGLDLIVESGEMVAIVGASGSGKSTLLNILGGLDTASAGRAWVAGHDLLAMDDADRVTYRRWTIGFVWQQTGRNLLPYLTASENISVPLAVAGISEKVRSDRVDELLDVVSLSHRRDHRPDEMSGGEQQRVAVATALANQPSVLLADEPTGELDTDTSAEVFEVLRSASHDLGVTVLVLTHDPLVSGQVERTVAIRDGRTSSETVRRNMGDEVIAHDYAVLDKVGRLQLPAEYVEALNLDRLVRLELEPDHIGVWPDRDPEGEENDG
ncbi:MAG: ATP-binding cassette domain-containing protein [Acidimicrobiia bacterium]|nr:ATP-binding cassette domain-containing protein [Acidimicrobiia bacterium]